MRSEDMHAAQSDGRYGLRRAAAGIEKVEMEKLWIIR